MSNGNSESSDHICKPDLALLVDARLAKSTLFHETNPHVHVVPSTSNPAPVGFLGFGFCCILLMGVFTGWIDHEAKNIVIAYSFTFAGLGQLITGLLEYNRKNVFACNAFLTYGCFFLGFAFENVMRSVGLWKANPKGDQMAFILWGCITFLFWIQTLILNIALSALFLCVSILFWCVAAEQTNASLSHGTGWFGVFTGIISIYVGMAIFFVENYGKEVLPLGHLKDWTAMWSRRRLGPVGTKRVLADEDATNV